MPPSVNSTTAASRASEYSDSSNDGSVATVQVGENSLSQVAQRLGIDLESLLRANPQLSDASKIQAGQDIHISPSAGLPAPPDSQALSDSAPESGLPPAPLSDPLTRSMLQAQLGQGAGPGGIAIRDILEAARGNIMYADGDGAGSAAATKTGGTSAPPSTPHVALLKSPDAALQTPNPAVVSRLTRDLEAAMKQAEASTKKSEASAKRAESGTDKDKRIAEADKNKANQDLDHVDAVLREIVNAYGIGQDGVSALAYDPKAGDLGDTRTTAVTIGKDVLDPTELAKDSAKMAKVASVILHESNHARRNKELDDLGIDRGKFGTKAETVFADLSEMESYQLEFNNQKKLGTPDNFAKGAESKRQEYLKDLKMAGAGRDLIKLAEDGKFDEAFKKFRESISLDPQTQKYMWKK